MGEECHDNAISTFFLDPTLVPADAFFISESTWKNNKDNLKDNTSYSLINWENIT